MLILIWTQCNTIHFCSTFCASIPEHFLIKLKLALNNLQIPKRFIKKKKKSKQLKTPPTGKENVEVHAVSSKLKEAEGQIVSYARVRGWGDSRCCFLASLGCDCRGRAVHCTDLLARMNFRSAVNDLEVAGEAIQGGVIRSPFMYALFWRLQLLIRNGEGTQFFVIHGLSHP